MVYGSDEEEVQIRQPADFELGALDQDFEWIQEEIDAYMGDIKSKDPVISHVQKAIEKGKRKIPEELRDMTISEVQNLEENFQKVIGYSCKSYITSWHNASITWL